MNIQNYDDYEILANPLPNRDNRVWEAGRNTVTTGAYAMALAKERVTGKPYILVTHGGGSEALALESSYCSLPVLLELAGDNERALYGILFSMYQMAIQASRAATDSTAMKYRRAFANGTLKKRKQRGANGVKVWIEERAT